MKQQRTIPNLQTTPQRRYDIDALRVLAVLLLIFFHTAMIFAVDERWHVRNDALSDGWQLFVNFVGQWHMPLLFLLAGASSYYALQFRSARQYVGERVTRLLLPLIIGILVVIPPQVYIERISPWMRTRLSPINFEGSFFNFYPHFFDCCYSEGNFTYHHLWFVAYLFIYSLLALPIFRYLQTPAGQARISALADRLGRGSAIFWFAVPIAIIEIMLRPRFPNWQDFIHDWANNAHYFTIFLIGYLLFADYRFQEAIAHNKRWALGLGVVAAAGYFLIETEALRLALRAFSEWGWIIALLGYGRRWLNIPSSWLRYASEIAYPFYIFHQTVIVFIAYFVVRWSLGISAKYAVIAATSILLTVLLCELIKLTNLTRIGFGLKWRK